MIETAFDEDAPGALDGMLHGAGMSTWAFLPENRLVAADLLGLLPRAEAYRYEEEAGRMSAPVMPPPAAGAERLERLEAAFLRSPSLDVAAAVAGHAEPPSSCRLRGTPEQADGPEALMTKYSTHGVCCR